MVENKIFSTHEWSKNSILNAGGKYQHFYSSNGRKLNMYVAQLVEIQQKNSAFSSLKNSETQHFKSLNGLKLNMIVARIVQ